MAPEPTECPAPDCDHSFGLITGNALAQLIELHARTAHPVPANAAPQPAAAKAEKVRRPVIGLQGTQEDWSYFQNRWAEYKAATKIAGDEVVSQLLETCEEPLRKDLHRCYGRLDRETEVNVLKYMKILAIRPENIMVARVKLQNLHQERDESVRSFVARLRGQAGVCSFTKTQRCQCTQDVTLDYTEDMVRDALITGLEDEEIRLHILRQANQNMTLEETLQLAEAQECGRRSAGRLTQHTELQSQTTANATSTYRRRSNAQLQQRNTQPTQSPQPYQRNNQHGNQSDTKPNPSKCSHCGQQGHGSGRNYHSRKKNCPAFNHECTKCGILHHLESLCMTKQRAPQHTTQRYPTSPANQDAVFEEFDNSGFFTSSDQMCPSYDK